MTNDGQRVDALPQGSALNSYVVERVLGSGAFGVTYLVKHRHLGSLHVIKEYIPDCGIREQNRSTVSPKSAGDKDLFEWGLKCFFDEARLLYQLSHPHVVKVTDLFDDNSTAYFVMPYLKGITLHQWMKQHPNPSQSELEAIFVPLLEGLKYIHDKGLLHRDIKPENIYITDNTNPVLIDFGSARIAIGQKSKALTQILTPHFAPIEQYRTKGTFTPALDLYSMAACMFQAITGKLPEEAPNRLEEDEQPRLAGSEYGKRYAGHFLLAIDKSLSVYAKDRHQDGFALQKDLVGGLRRSSQTFLGQQDGIIELTDVVEEGLFNNNLTQSMDIPISKKLHKTGEIWTEPYTSMEFIWVPGGTFEMGDVCGDGREDEKPVHTVDLDGFWLGKFPVTQSHWEKVMDSNPSLFKGPDNPVERVSWIDAQKFINKLDNRSAATGFRLPTEAEWEYAARSGGRTELFSGGNDVDHVAWYSGNSGGMTKPVGGKAPNGLGIFDMSGNVWEWVEDVWDNHAYSRPNRRNSPVITSGGSGRVNRGGSWINEPVNIRVACRDWALPEVRYRYLGFRLALTRDLH